MLPYERFEAWKLAHKLALEIHRATDKWPASERYQLTSQIRRAALSIPTNIAEGAAKRGSREFRRYLDIARGSLSELSYLLRFSRDRGILDDETFSTLEELRDHRKSDMGVVSFPLSNNSDRLTARPTSPDNPDPP